MSQSVQILPVMPDGSVRTTELLSLKVSTHAASQIAPPPSNTMFQATLTLLKQGPRRSCETDLSNRYRPGIRYCLGRHERWGARLEARDEILRLAYLASCQDLKRTVSRICPQLSDRHMPSLIRSKFSVSSTVSCASGPDSASLPALFCHTASVAAERGSSFPK